MGTMGKIAAAVSVGQKEYFTSAMDYMFKVMEHVFLIYSYFGIIYNILIKK